MSQQPNNRFYASLLDSWQDYLDTNAEDFFYQDEQGNWHKNWNEETGEFALSEEEVFKIAKQSFLDKINRIPQEPSMAADKGTMLNEIVDCLVMNKPCTKEGMTVKTIKEGTPSVYASVHGFEFYFDLSLVKSLGAYFSDALCQTYVSTIIETKYGKVELYGYPDYIRGNKVYDLKTTKQYQFGKYEKKWQKHLYPYALIKNGSCTDIKEFEYTCCKLSGGTSRTPVITADIYPEIYTFDYTTSEQMLIQHCERLCEFIQENRNLITDSKIINDGITDYRKN